MYAAELLNAVARVVVQVALFLHNCSGFQATESTYRQVIAEGVETTEQLHELREIGILTGQGYLFSKAVPLNDFVELARKEIMIGGSPLRRLLV